MITMAATAIGMALIGVGATIVWTRGRRDAGGNTIHLVASRYLGGKRFLTLVEVDGERLLLGLAGEQVSLVARLTQPSDHAERA